MAGPATGPTQRFRGTAVTTETQSQTSTDLGRPYADSGVRAIIDSLDVAVLVLDEKGTIRYRNKAASAMFPEGDDVASAFRGCRFPATFGGWETEIPRLIERREPRRLSCTFPAAEAPSQGLATLHCTPLAETDADRVTGVVILIDDARSEEVGAERVEVLQRLASLGKLAARVAHELNNPLDGILRYINLALRTAEDTQGSKLKSYLTESRTGLIRMVQIIGELLEFSRTTEGEFDEADINELVEQAIRNTTSTADIRKIVVTEDFQTQDMPAVPGSRLYQVCCNLIKNAIDAMPDGGRLSVATGLADGEVVIRVADTGVGLPAEADQVFEPFFTTKSAGKGTGLGLAICKDFVEDMNGTITASPGEDGGAVFTIHIPVTSCHRRSSATGAPPMSRRRLTGA